MDIKIPTSSTLPTPLLDALRRNVAAQAATASQAASSAVSFSGALDQALRAVSASQSQADQLADRFQRDPASVSVEETMVALQQSQIGFQSALHVRNRLVSAYTDIMNMPV